MTLSLAQAILTASRSMPADNGYALVPDAALHVLIEHAQGLVTRQDPPDPVLSGPAAFVKRQALRDQFAMYAPIEPIAFTDDLDSIGLKRRVALALAYADEMMRQTGRP